MDKLLTENVKNLVCQLIYGVSGFDRKHEHFNEILDYSFAHICSPDYFNNYSKSDISQTVKNLAEKFKFHAFPVQANYLLKLTDKLLNSCKNSDDLEVNLAILKLLLTVSRSPVKYFIEDVTKFQPLPENVEQIVDWGSYLNNCRVVLKQNYVETSDEEWSDFTESDVEDIPQFQYKPVQTCLKTGRKAENPIFRYNITEGALIAKQELSNSIQTNWWNTKTITVVPSSNSCESKIALEWDKYVSEMALGLVTPNTNIIPEYRIIRELIWQFFVPHSCFSFGFEYGRIRPKSGVTIGSLRPQTLQKFLNEFMPYIEKLRAFRTFHESLLGDYFVTSIPDTYRSYWEALEELLFPVYEKIQGMEDSIRKQDNITTILKVASDLKPIFKNISILSLIHNDITQNYNVELTFQNSTFLLSRLFFGLLNSANTTEQNIYLTLYLKSLYKYFTIIQIWLEQDTLDDQSDEFIVYIKNSRPSGGNTSVEYKLKTLEAFSEIDGMMQIIQKKVLQMAKNIHLLRLLGKLYLVSDQMDTFKVSLHEEFIEKIITEASNYSQNLENTSNASESTELLENPDVFTVICPEKQTSKTGTDSVENFLELSDGFLATIFQPFLFKEMAPGAGKPQTLYEIINSKITRMFPAKQILEKTFLEVLNSRYSIPGLLVKDILLEQFKLMRYFYLMKHLYLFDEDIIFPFYKNMFLQFENQQAWGNFFWLTSQLQDLLMDLYPDVYENCRVDVDPTWRLCTNPIAACDLVTLHVRLDWPINLIFRQEHKKMYNSIFQFLLKIKWALNTLNRLQFSELEPKSRPFRLQPKIIQQRIRKLQAMRFVLLNDLSSIQHYILGHLLSVLWGKFFENFAKSYDLESIIKAHDIFIKSIYKFCMRVKHEKSEMYGFKKILSLVLQLQNMWKDVIKIDDKILHKCEIDYRKSHKFLRPIIDVEVVIECN